MGKAATKKKGKTAKKKPAKKSKALVPQVSDANLKELMQISPDLNKSIKFLLQEKKRLAAPTKPYRQADFTRWQYTRMTEGLQHRLECVKPLMIQNYTKKEIVAQLRKEGFKNVSLSTIKRDIQHLRNTMAIHLASVDMETVAAESMNTYGEIKRKLWRMYHKVEKYSQKVHILAQIRGTEMAMNNLCRMINLFEGDAFRVNIFIERMDVSTFREFVKNNWDKFKGTVCESGCFFKKWFEMADAGDIKLCKKCQPLLKTLPPEFKDIGQPES